MDPKDRWESGGKLYDPYEKDYPNEKFGPGWKSDPQAGDKAIEKSDDAWRQGKDQREKDFRQKIDAENKTLKQNLKAGIEKYFDEYKSAKAFGPYSVIDDISIAPTEVTSFPDDRVKKEIRIQKAKDALKHLGMSNKEAKENPEKFLEDLLAGKLDEGRTLRLSVKELRGVIRECIVASSDLFSSDHMKRRW